jgi:hypothetical protein
MYALFCMGVLSRSREFVAQLWCWKTCHYGFESLMDGYLAVRVKEMVTIPTTQRRKA